MLKSISNKISKPVFGADTPEEAVARFVDEVKKFPENRNLLVALLPEQNPLYAGRGVNRAARLRGYILAAFGQVGLPDKALTYVLDELENGDDAYSVAAAARALSGSKEPSPRFVSYLIKAIRNIRYDDDSLTFDCYKPKRPLSNGTTALAEIFRTFAWMGAYAKEALPDLENLSNDREYNFSASVRAEFEKAMVSIKTDNRLTEAANCCSVPANFRFQHQNAGFRLKRKKLCERVEFEDQDGNAFKYQEFFSRKPVIVVFFYTRCDNPNKCSLTVTKLARLQKALQEQGIEDEIKTAALTYDPNYDFPPRLKAYGQNRGVSFGEQNKIFRSTRGFDELQDYFGLGVNFAGSAVNKHRIELYILDSNGSIAVAFERLQWEVSEVIKQTKLLLKNENENPLQKKHYFFGRIFHSGKTICEGVFSLLVPLIIVFFPKCPICWAAYLSLFGITGLQSVPYSPWLLPVFALLMIVNLFSIFKRAKVNGRTEAFCLTLLGALIILIPGILFSVPYIPFLGMTMIFVGSLMSSLSNKKTARIGYRLEQNRT